MLLGRPGSGKSTYALKLHKRLAIPLHHLDRYFYAQNWKETSMASRTFPLLNESDCKKLNKALNFMKMEELRTVLRKMELPDKGKKVALIERIMHFIKTGETKKVLTFPAASKAQKGIVYPLHPDTLMMRGAYKNDLKARMFLKKLIGNHFHYTAFGIDWLTQRWLDSNPPTYQEFADFWQEETARRKKQKVGPKQEWAYLNFIKAFLTRYPNAERDDVMQAWEQVRNDNVKIARDVLKKISYKSYATNENTD